MRETHGFLFDAVVRGTNEYSHLLHFGRQLPMHMEHRKVRERLDAARKAETARIEERKNSHIERLMKAHEKAFAEIKNYYNDITHNNLDLIRSLKEEVGGSLDFDGKTDESVNIPQSRSKRRGSDRRSSCFVHLSAIEEGLH